MADNETITFDLWSGDTYEPTFDMLHHLGDVTVVRMSFTAKPYGRGAPFPRR